MRAGIQVVLVCFFYKEISKGVFLIMPLLHTSKVLEYI